MSHPFANRTLQIVSDNAFEAMLGLPEEIPVSEGAKGGDGFEAFIGVEESSDDAGIAGKCFFCEADITASDPLFHVIYHDDLYHGAACVACASADAETLAGNLRDQIERHRRMIPRHDDDSWHAQWISHLEVVLLVFAKVGRE